MLLLTLPSLVAGSQTLQSEFSKQQHHKAAIDLQALLSYDEIMFFLEQIESGRFEHYCNEEDLDHIVRFVTLLAKEGSPNIEEISDEMAYLLDYKDNPYETAFKHHLIPEFSLIVTQVNAKSIYFDSQPGFIPCGGWWSDKWERVKKFCRENKGAIIVGTVVIVATVAVVTLTTFAAPAAGAGLAGLGGVINENKAEEEKNVPSVEDTASPPDPPSQEDLVSESQIKVYAPPGGVDFFETIHSNSRDVRVLGFTPIDQDLDSDSPLILQPLPVGVSEFMSEALDQQLSHIKAELGSEIPSSRNLEQMKAFSVKSREIVSYAVHIGFDYIAEHCSELPRAKKMCHDQISKMDSYLLHFITADFIDHPMETYEMWIARAHALIDYVFSTEQANAFSVEEKAKNDWNYSDAAFLGNPTKLVKSFSKLTKADRGLITKLQKVWRKKALRESCAKFAYAESYLKRHRNKILPEKTIRQYIHSVGIKTFPRPKGIPKNYVVKVSKGGGGMVYVNPTNNHFSVRVMPGKPHSPFPHQQRPYIIHRHSGDALDKFGNIVNADSAEAHIPIKEFIFER